MNKTKILSIVFVAVIIIVIGVIIYKQQSSSSVSGKNLIAAGQKQYRNEGLGVSFNYPENLVFAERSATGDKQQPIIITLSSRHGQILLVPSIRMKEDIEREKVFYEGILFKGDNSKVNSRITIGKMEGFKSLVNFEESLYTLYGLVDATSSLTLRTQITASSSEALIDLENGFRLIVESIRMNNDQPLR